MRILKLRLRNLNSLVGAWEIDFANPSFTSDGLFAITGPTGSGKTTILDAICLALYGRTPRLDRVNKSSNEVMSRQTGECYAEVIFQNQKGRYLCHWGQQRSRKKVDGNLQNPKHEIVEADSGKVLETHLRKVAEKVEEVTGMDFDRFTRSMLLAQGGFAAFLQASPDERAPILEQITGTEIYSQISLEVHKRKSEEKVKLDKIQVELSGMQPLSAEDEQKFTALHEEKKEKANVLTQEIEKKNKTVNWLSNIEKLNQEITTFTDRQEKLHLRIEAFQKDARKLERAKQALEFSADYATLTMTRKTQADEKAALEKLTALVPEFENKAKALKEKESEFEKFFSQRKAEQKEGLQTIQKVRELDLFFKQKESEVKETQSSCKILEASLKETRSKREESNKSLKKADLEFQTLEVFLKENAIFEQLVNDFSRIEERFSHLQVLMKKLEENFQQISITEKQTKESHDLYKQAQAELEKLKKDREEKAKDLKAIEEKLQKKLQGKEIHYWRKELSVLTGRKSCIEQAIATGKKIAEIENSLLDLVDHEKSLTLKEEDLGKLEEGKKEKLASLENELQHLQTQLILLNRIKDLEEARHNLEDGKPCPLCGALEHPFAMENAPQPNEAENAIRDKKKAIKVLNSQLSEVLSDRAKTHKEKELISQSHQEKTKQLKTYQQCFSEELVLAKVEILEGSDSSEILQRLIKDVLENYSVTTSLVEEIEKLEKDFSIKQKFLEEAKEHCLSSEKKVSELGYKKETKESDGKRLQKEKESLELQMNSYRDETLQRVQPYGIESLSVDVFDDILKSLNAKRQDWQKSQKRKNDLDKELVQAKGLEKQLIEQMTKLEAEIKEKRVALEERTKDRDRLLEERKKLFQEKNPDDEEAKLSEALEQAEKTLEEARKVFSIQYQELMNQKSRMKTLEQGIKSRSETLEQQENSFASQLDKSKFQDEEDFKNACLGENERRDLENQEKVLLREKTELESALKDRKERLAVEKEKKLTEQSNDELKTELEELAKSLNEHQQEIGSIRQKLEENKLLRLRMKDRVKAMEAQKKEFDRWDILHTLIGSSDGKKYRNFAQGLTFEMMVVHANLQLQKMTDRYLLTRDVSQPLDLNVVDNYQGGETRTTKNLSGGESFIISLSLALGLSSMASQNVKVDSLFLDEGFGTLDEDALDTALDTLAGLHQDGKLIGVISHVPTLKERINSQIQVIPLTGGRSSVSGPGCMVM